VVTRVVTTDEFATWFAGLSGVEHSAVARLVGLLEAEGVNLGFPYSSSIKGSKHALRELRKKGQPIRLIYAFDPKRQAVMLIGGDKTGDDRFYKHMVPRAEKLWERYLAELAAGLHDEEE
jgi:hypothetical protein